MSCADKSSSIEKFFDFYSFLLSDKEIMEVVDRFFGIEDKHF